VVSACVGGHVVAPRSRRTRRATFLIFKTARWSLGVFAKTMWRDLPAMEIAATMCCRSRTTLTVAPAARAASRTALRQWCRRLTTRLFLPRARGACRQGARVHLAKQCLLKSFPEGFRALSSRSRPLHRRASDKPVFAEFFEFSGHVTPPSVAADTGTAETREGAMVAFKAQWLRRPRSTAGLGAGLLTAPGIAGDHRRSRANHP